MRKIRKEAKMIGDMFDFKKHDFSKESKIKDKLFEKMKLVYEKSKSKQPCFPRMILIWYPRPPASIVIFHARIRTGVAMNAKIIFIFKISVNIAIKNKPMH